MRNEFPTLAADPIKALRDGIAERKARLAVFNKVAEIIKPLEGKKVTQAFATKIINGMPEGTLSYYQKGSSLYKVSVWGNGVDFKDRIEINLAYVSAPEFSYEKFLKNLNCFYMEADRISQLERAECDLPRAILNYAKALEAMEAAREAMDAFQGYAFR